MRRIAVINQKGGVGKTTTTVNLAAALAAAGKRVCVLDLDPQAHASTHLGAEPDGQTPSLYDVLVANTPLATVRRTIEPNLFLCPSDINLAAAEVELAGIVGREVLLREALAADAAPKPNPPGPPSLGGKGGDGAHSSLVPVIGEATGPEAAHLKHPSPSGGGAGGGVAPPGARTWQPSPPGPSALLGKGVGAVGRGLAPVVTDAASVARGGDFDYLLMDCGPSLGVLTLNALAAADEVFIPLQPHFFALHGLSKLLETTALVARRINPAVKVSGIVVCLYDAATRLAQEVVTDLNAFLGQSRGANVPWAAAKVFDTRIRRNVKLAECPSYGKSIFAYAPRSSGAADYAALAAEVLGVAPPVVVGPIRVAADPVEARMAGGVPAVA
ncbi:MAG TPA: AAA family ATPase [Urbifossiella sp.]|nr:AAA family ATPase [Urbifossiella sp.]